MTWEGAEENYNVFRWYRAGWGRYTQEDPVVANPRSLRHYTYALSNPLSLIDPRGLFAVDPFCKGCKNPLAARDKSNLFQHIVAQTNAFCQNSLQYIKDVNLRDCVKKSCEIGIIKCDISEDSGPCNDLSTYGYTPTAAFDFVAKMFPRRTVYVCANKVGNFNQEAGNTVVHEWAHGCGYDADKGLAGVPGAQ